jgi:phospholipid/cholesterol/gamma-HCH transport system ATP-binding protein
MLSTLAKYFLLRPLGRGAGVMGRVAPSRLQPNRQTEEPSEPSDSRPEGAAPGPTPIVDIRNLVYRVAERTVFDGVNIAIARGQVTAIMGPSGVGKTTLLRLITGQASADSGSIVVAGRELRALPLARLYELRRRMGMLFQNSALLTDLSVYENVAFPLRELTNLPERLIQQLVLIKLQAVGLRGACTLMPNELSGGMARRVALARAIVMDPEILLYDEPFVGLDPISLGVILRLIRRLNDALGLTSIIVSHGIQQISAIADRIILLSGGKVIADGSPAEMQACPSAAVRQFMAGSAAGPVPFHYSAPDYFTELMARGRKVTDVHT